MLLIFALPPDSGAVFEFVYNKYKSLMLKKAASILADGMLAEDAVSEAFIRIYKNLGKLDPPDSPMSASFIFTVVKNVALTMRRREQTFDADIDGEFDAADGFDLEGDVLSRLSSQRIVALIGQVPEDLKSVFLLKYAHGYSHREIGRILNITENNVTVRMHRARKAIAQILEKEGYTVEK